MKEIVEKAAAATSKVEDEIELALAALAEPRRVNGHGVYIERLPVMQAIATASNALARAAEAVSGKGAGYAWPGPADYAE